MFREENQSLNAIQKWYGFSFIWSIRQRDKRVSMEKTLYSKGNFIIFSKTKTLRIKSVSRHRKLIRNFLNSRRISNLGPWGTSKTKALETSSATEYLSGPTASTMSRESTNDKFKSRSPGEQGNQTSNKGYSAAPGATSSLKLREKSERCDFGEAFGFMFIEFLMLPLSRWLLNSGYVHFEKWKYIFTYAETLNTCGMVVVVWLVYVNISNCEWNEAIVNNPVKRKGS